MIWYIGLDDTDNKNSRGTGFKSRQLGKLIVEQEIGEVLSISRHQLFVNDQIAYTSQNSSACLLVKSGYGDVLKDLCIQFIREVAEPGSDAGLCIAREESVDERIEAWGRRAKEEVLRKENAYQLAKETGIFLKGYTGTKIGVIGSLAAVGLRKSGNDGRNIWLKGKELRDLQGVYTVKELKRIINIQVVKSVQGKVLRGSDRIDVGDWLRPVIQNNKNTVIVESIKNQNNYEWKAVSKDFIKSISD
ncbi:MAG: hypothetical protein V2I54_04055 [Bacteroidales bacterium]|jgi:hypothetical protein|nr:hypothetical protein [Bacteroidales bacterium]